MGTLHEYQYIVLIISRWVLPWMKMFKKNVEEMKTHISYSITFVKKKKSTVHEIMWKNFVQLGRPQMTIWRMCIAYWTPKATNTLSEYITHCFSTATMVALTHLNVAQYVHCPSCIEWTLLPTHYKVQRVIVAPEGTEWHTLARTPLNRLVAETTHYIHSRQTHLLPAGS